MHIIVFSNPKGGTGKSTSALILAEQLAKSGLKVGLIDNDPTQNLIHWDKMRFKASRPQKFEIYPKTSPDTYDELIEQLERVKDIVIVDMEGVKDLMANVVTMTADIVVIPMQASPMDARNASSQLSIIKIASKHTKRNIPYTFAFTRTNATIATRLYQSIKSEMNGQPILPVNLVERAAYKHMHEDGHLLAELDSDLVSGVEKAISNATDFAQSIIDCLKDAGENK